MPIVPLLESLNNRSYSYCFLSYGENFYPCDAIVHLKLNRNPLRLVVYRRIRWFQNNIINESRPRAAAQYCKSGRKYWQARHFDKLLVGALTLIAVIFQAHEVLWCGVHHSSASLTDPVNYLLCQGRRMVLSIIVSGTLNSPVNYSIGTLHGPANYSVRDAAWSCQLLCTGCRIVLSITVSGMLHGPVNYSVRDAAWSGQLTVSWFGQLTVSWTSLGNIPIDAYC